MEEAAFTGAIYRRFWKPPILSKLTVFARTLAALFQHSMLEGILHQLGARLQAEVFHDRVFVKGHGGACPAAALVPAKIIKPRSVVFTAGMDSRSAWSTVFLKNLMASSGLPTTTLNHATQNRAKNESHRILSARIGIPQVYPSLFIQLGEVFGEIVGIGEFMSAG